MGLFNSFFNEGSAEQRQETNWIPLTDKGQLDAIEHASGQKPVVIFKHSTRCNISRMALRQFEGAFDPGDRADVYFLDLLQYRDISNDIAARFNIQHQSPQVILIRNGKAVYNASHESINARNLEQYL